MYEKPPPTYSINSHPHHLIIANYTMTPNQTKDLNNFLAFTNTEQLGEGDVNAGANLLATAACTIANLTHPGSGIKSQDGSNIKVRSSLLIKGSFSSNLIRDHVSSELTSFQDNWTAHLKRYLEDITDEKAKLGMKSFNIPNGPPASDSENRFMALQQPNPILWGTSEEEWADIIASPPTPNLLDMTAFPKVIVTATGDSSLNKQLIGLHRNRPLVIMGLTAKSASLELATTATALMNGTLPDDRGIKTIDGNMLILDAENRLVELADSSQKNDIRWLGNMPWLVDGGAGPEADPILKENTQPIDQMPERIKTVLHHAMARRLRNDKTHSTIYEEKEFIDAQKRWIQFLKSMENSLPGITGSARQLLATLVFGIREITHIRGYKKVTIHISYIESFARHLILRMSNARDTIYTDADTILRTRLMRTIIVKLQHGGQSPRTIYRGLGINAELFHDIINEMENKKHVQKSDKEWLLTENTISLLQAQNINQINL